MPARPNGAGVSQGGGGRLCSVDDGARGKASRQSCSADSRGCPTSRRGCRHREQSRKLCQGTARPAQAPATARPVRATPCTGCGDRTATRTGVGPVAAIHPVPPGGKLGRHRGLSLSPCPLNNGRPCAGPALLLPGAQQAGICWQRTRGGRPQVCGGAGRLPGPSRQVPRG